MSIWRNELESWLNTIDVSGSVLDIGGAQKTIQGRTKTWNVDKYEIADITTGFDLSKPLVGKYEPADNVFCLETLMYCTDPAKAIQNLVSLTKKNLYISNPLEGYPETKPANTDMSRLMPNWFNYWLKDMDAQIDIIYPKDSFGFHAATATEGYKLYRPHASGILIHAKKL